MKLSELCSMIEESMKSGRYPLETETQKRCSGQLKVTSKSAVDDLTSGDSAVAMEMARAVVVVEVRLGDLYVETNFSPTMQHLPGLIEMDVLDSFRLICRKIDRIDTGVKIKQK